MKYPKEYQYILDDIAQKKVDTFNEHLHRLFSSFGYHEAKIIEKLVQNGADINSLDPMSHNTLLIKACQHKPKTVTFLLTLGADPNFIRVENGKFDCYTPLHAAIQYNSKDFVLLETLLEHGANPNVVVTADSTKVFHKTPLLYATTYFEEAIDILIQYGADIYYKDKEGHTILDHCLEPAIDKVGSFRRLFPYYKDIDLNNLMEQLNQYPENLHQWHQLEDIIQNEILKRGTLSLSNDVANSLQNYKINKL